MPSWKRPLRRVVVVIGASGLAVAAYGWMNPPVSPIAVPPPRPTVSVLTPPPKESAPVPSTSTTAAPASSADAGAAPKPRDLASCVADQFPPDTFAGASLDFAPFCADADPRHASGTLRSLVVSAAANKQVTDAMREWSLMDWYQMAAVSMIRARCCESSPPLKLPPPIGVCGQIDKALNDLGTAVRDGASIDAPLGRFRSAIFCASAGESPSYTMFKAKPEGGEEPAFRKFFTRASEHQ